MAKYKRAQLDKIQIDYGIIYINYGEIDARKLGPTRGGGTFEATQTIRDIEFDGRIGKTKGLQTIDYIDAKLVVNNLAVTNDDLEIIMPYLTKSGTDPDFIYTAEESSLGLIPNEDYLKNVTMFAKLIDGSYKKITLYNAMNEAPFSFAAVDKNEAEVSMEIFAHWEVDEDDAGNIDKLFQVEEVASIA